MDLKTQAKSELPAFLHALRFLTRLPVPVGFSPDAQAQSPRWYPAVGAVIGLISGVMYWGAALMFPPVVAVLIALATAMIVTGALHEDGFADACDGLGGDRPKSRVLEIMRDSRIGTYGVLGLGLMVATTAATLTALPATAVPFVLIASHAASRASMLWAMASSDYVRDAGAATGMAGRLDRRAILIGFATAALALLPLLFVLPVLAVATALVGLGTGHYAMRQRYESRLGGYTGDCLGAVQQVSALGFCLGALAAI